MDKHEMTAPVVSQEFHNCTLPLLQCSQRLQQVLAGCLSEAPR